MIKKHNLRRFPRYSQACCPFAKGQFSTTVLSCSSTILRKQPPQFYGQNHIRFLFKKVCIILLGLRLQSICNNLEPLLQFLLNAVTFPLQTTASWLKYDIPVVSFLEKSP